MRRVAILLTLALASMSALALTSCSRTLQDKVEGTWAADFMASLEDQELTAEQLQQVQQMSQNISLRLVFAEDGTMTASTAGLSDEERTETGRWEVVQTEGNTITIRTRKGTEGSEEQVQDLVLTFDSDDRFTADLGGRTTVFTRQ